MIDLSTYYMGRKLSSPLMASSSPLCKDLTNLQKMEEAGAGAVVLHSLFEEQITLESQSLDQFLNAGSESYAEFTSYFPDLGPYDIGPRAYLLHIQAAKKALKIPVIASLNGASLNGWIRYAREIEDAGADALELNIYFLPASFEISGAQIEDDYCELVSAVKAHVRIPVAVKLGPFFTSVPQSGLSPAMRGRERSGIIQPLLSARFRFGDAPGDGQLEAQHLRRTAAALARRGAAFNAAQFGPRDHRRRAYL